jgi:hypothetical protein
MLLHIAGAVGKQVAALGFVPVPPSVQMQILKLGSVGALLVSSV